MVEYIYKMVEYKHKMVEYICNMVEYIYKMVEHRCKMVEYVPGVPQKNATCLPYCNLTIKTPKLLSNGSF